MKKSLAMKRYAGTAALLALAGLGACSQADTKTSESVERSTDAATFGKSALLIIGWNTKVEAEPDTISGLVRSHASKCVKAGTQDCVVMDAKSEGDEQTAFGQLRVRASPIWLDTFRTEIAGEIEAKGGRIISEGLNIDNVSDEARDLSDIQKAQRQEAAAAQADNVTDAAAPAARPDIIDNSLSPRQQTTRDLQDLRARAKMQELLITYNPKPSLATTPGGQMVAASLRDVGNVVGLGLGSLIYVLAFAVPFGLLALLWRTVSARLSRKPAPIQTEPSVPA
jgi:hypothetical protein